MDIKISHEGPSGKTKVLAGGLDITNSLSGLGVNMGAKGVTTISLELVDFGTIELDLADPTIVLSKVTIKALRLMGWTEPS